MNHRPSPAETTNLPTGTWKLDPAATTVTVAAKKLLLWTIPATLTVTDGTVEIDETGKVAGVEVVADAGSYTSKNSKRDEHVVGSDFLHATEHPTITFRSGTVAPAIGGHRADGTVTIKGRTSPIAVTIGDLAIDDTTATFAATTTVDRRALGVDKLPALVIGHELQLSVRAAARKME